MGRLGMILALGLRPKKGVSKPTIKFVLELPPRGQLDTFHLRSWQHHLQYQAQKIVCQHIASDSEVEQAGKTFLGPSSLLLQLLEGQSRRLEDGRSGAARNIVAKEGGKVDDKWKAEGDANSTDSVFPSTKVPLPNRGVWRDIRPAKLIAMLLGRGCRS